MFYLTSSHNCSQLNFCQSLYYTFKTNVTPVNIVCVVVDISSLIFICVLFFLDRWKKYLFHSISYTSLCFHCQVQSNVPFTSGNPFVSVSSAQVAMYNLYVRPTMGGSFEGIINFVVKKRVKTFVRFFLLFCFVCFVLCCV